FDAVMGCTHSDYANRLTKQWHFPNDWTTRRRPADRGAPLAQQDYQRKHLLLVSAHGKLDDGNDPVLQSYQVRAQHAPRPRYRSCPLSNNQRRKTLLVVQDQVTSTNYF